MDAGSGRLFGLPGQCVDAREIQTESPGDFFGGEKAPGKEGPDDSVLFFAGSLLDSLLDSLLNAFLGRFFEHLIDDVGGHAFLPEDGDKSLYDVLRTGDAVIACEIGEFRLQYTIGGLSLPDLLQEDPEATVQVVVDVLEGQEGENRREVFQTVLDFPVVDAGHVDDRKGEIGRRRGENRRGKEDSRKPLRKSPWSLSVIEEDGQDGQRFLIVSDLAGPESCQIVGDLVMDQRRGGALNEMVPPLP